MSRVLFETLLSVNWFVQTTVNIPAACFYFAFMFFFRVTYDARTFPSDFSHSNLEKGLSSSQTMAISGLFKWPKIAIVCCPRIHCGVWQPKKKITKTGKKRRNMGGSAKKKKGGNVNVFRFCE